MVDEADLKRFEVTPGDEDAISDKSRVVNGNEQYFAISSRAKYERGILYRGPYENLNDGVCVAVRRHARALRSTGIPVFLESTSFTVMGSSGAAVHAKYCDLDPAVLEQVGDLTSCQQEQSAVAIYHITPTTSAIQNIAFPKHMGASDPNGVRRINAVTILMCAWERDFVGPETVSLINQLGQVWVPCSYNKRSLERSGVTIPVHVVPHPVLDGDPFLSREKRGAPGDTIRFLNVGKWEPRKDHHALIGGFLRWFRPIDNVELVLKTKPFGAWKGYVKDVAESVSLWLADPRVCSNGWTQELVNQKIRIISAMLNREDLCRLYGACDIYVASGHGEGFDLPAFDARLMGLPLVYCKTSGAADFASELDTVIATDPAPCNPQYGWEPEATWGGYGADDIGYAMHVAKGKASEGILPSRLDASKYSMAAIGKLMRGHCNDLVRYLGGSIEDIQID